jgi:hypothetical protein
MSYSNEINHWHEERIGLSFSPEMVAATESKLFGIFDKEIARLQNLLDIKNFQIEVLEHNIDLLDSNYRKLVETFDTSGLNLLKLPESLKPQISLEGIDFKVIPADEGQDLSKHTEIKLDDI